MRRTLAIPLALLMCSGCGDAPAPPPDAAASRQLVSALVLDWHRLQAARDGTAGCALLTERSQAELLKVAAEFADAVGKPRPDDCPEAIAGRPAGAAYQDAMTSTQVDAVRVDGARATATVHATLSVGGVMRPTPPTDISLRWTDGHWLID